MKRLVAPLLALGWPCLCAAGILVTDLAGEARIDKKGVLAVLAEVADGNQVTLAGGTRMVAVDLASGREFTFHGPGSYAVEKDGPRTLKGQAVETKSGPANNLASVRLTPKSVAQATLVMRAAAGLDLLAARMPPLSLPGGKERPAWLSIAPERAAEALARGIALRNDGSLQQALDYFESLRQAGGDMVIAATGEAGATLLQARQYERAEPLLTEAHARSAGSERARYAIELGNLAAARHRPDEAARRFAEARALAGANSVLGLVARVNETRLVGSMARPALLAGIARDAAGIADASVRGRVMVSVGVLATEAGSVQLAYESLDAARILAERAGDARLDVESLDALAKLYEGQGRAADALVLSRRGIARASSSSGMFADVLLRLEWRQGRLLAAQGADEEARAAYQRAVAHVEDIRQDIPIEYENGRSSFRDTLEPIYLGYVDLLLRQATAAAAAGERERVLRRARDIAELVKQSELQDYLGERCSVDSAQDDAPVGIVPGTAVLYPIVLTDRVEVLFETDAGIVRHTAPLDAAALRELVSSYTRQLRAGDDDAYRGGARRLYDALLRPFDKELAAHGIHTLLVVPDGVLRLLPWATLHDGERFLVQKLSVAVSSGLSMTSQAPARSDGFSALIAGVASPGPVVDVLADNAVEHIVDPSGARAVDRPANRGAVRAISVLAGKTRSAALREQLSLPGVRTEVEALAAIVPGTRLLDASFTTERLQREFDTGEYRIAHIATHGFFGSTGDRSFIMAYDDVVTMDGLQQLLRRENVRRRPLELLTLSACETAEGDDRSPLGIAGAAIKAKARSVLGTLWPVSDTAAQLTMTSFYESLVRDRVSKAEALRRAQVAVMARPGFEHPFYWAPFIMVGSWQ